MTQKRFVYYEHKGVDYILDTPNFELDFTEMLGDALEPEEIVDKLNELSQLNYNLTENARDYQKIARTVYKQNKQLEKENKELQEFKDKVFNSIDKTIESETQIAENIESTIQGDYVKAVNRLTIIAFNNLKKELSE